MTWVGSLCHSKTWYAESVVSTSLLLSFIGIHRLVSCVQIAELVLARGRTSADAEIGIGLSKDHGNGVDGTRSDATQLSFGIVRSIQKNTERVTQ